MLCVNQDPILLQRLPNLVRRNIAVTLIFYFVVSSLVRSQYCVSRESRLISICLPFQTILAHEGLMAQFSKSHRPPYGMTLSVRDLLPVQRSHPSAFSLVDYRIRVLVLAQRRCPSALAQPMLLGLFSHTAHVSSPFFLCSQLLRPPPLCWSWEVGYKQKPFLTLFTPLHSLAPTTLFQPCFPTPSLSFPCIFKPFSSLVKPQGCRSWDRKPKRPLLGTS